jgi:hypothetical protein
MRELLHLLLELGQLVLLSFEEFFGSSYAFYLVFLLFALNIAEFALIDLDELINIVQFFLDQLELLVEVRRR